MTHLIENVTAWAQTTETDECVVEAINEIATTNRHAHAIWSCPTDSERESVVARAKEISGDYPVCWGVDTF